MKELLDTIPAETWIAFFAALGTILTAIYAWIGRTIAKQVEKNTQIRLTDSMYRQIDIVAAWAASSTEQVFKRYVLPPEKTAEQKNNEKLDYAMKQARASLPAEVNEKFSDAQLATVIEAKVAQSKLPTTATLVATSIPPTNLLDPTLPKPAALPNPYK